VRSTAAPYTESRLTHLVRNKCVGFPVVEQSVCLSVSSDSFYLFFLFLYTCFLICAYLSLCGHSVCLSKCICMSVGFLDFPLCIAALQHHSSFVYQSLFMWCEFSCTYRRKYCKPPRPLCCQIKNKK
jgi:hypothetical protein